MILHKVTLTASSDSEPNKETTYAWVPTMPLEHLQSCIDKLQEHVNKLKAAQNDPTQAQKPISTGDENFVFQTPP